MSTLKKITALAVVWIGLAPLAWAQGGLTPEKLEITGDYEPNVSDLDKPRLETPGVEIKVDTRDVTYEEKDIQAETDYQPLEVKVPRPPKEKWPPLRNNFLKVGYGRFATPLAELHLHTGRNLNGSAGLDFSHISSSRGFVDYAEYREDRGGVKGEYYLKNNTAKAHFRLDNVNYFYFADTLVADRPDLKDSIRQTYTRLDFGASLMRNYDPNAINYDVGIGFEGYFDRYQNRELHFNILPEFDWKVMDNIYAGIGSQLTFSAAQFNSVSQNRFFLDFSPSVSYKKDRLQAEVGIKVNSYADSSSTFGAYPILKGSYELIEDKLTASLGLIGGMEYNRFYDLIEVNRYLDRAPDIRPTKNRLHFILGLEAGFGQYLTASVRGYSKNVEDQLVFFNPEGGAYFQMLYDSAYKETGSEIALMFNKDDKIRAGIRSHFRNFETSGVASNFGVPNVQVDLWGSYNFAKKVWVATEIYLYGNRAMTVDSTGNLIEQGFAADVNLSADYRFSDRISIFLELNNLLGTSYQQWYNYQVRPFDVKAGVTLSF